MASKPRQKPKPKDKLTDKEQSERFKETARKLGVKESEDFEQMVRKIAPAKRP
jgi:hypothetical protein